MSFADSDRRISSLSGNGLGAVSGPFCLLVHSAGRPAAPYARPPTAQANGHRLPHTSRAVRRGIILVIHKYSLFFLKFATQSKQESIVYIPKAFSLIPTQSNRQFKRKRSHCEALALAIIWASAHTIAVRAVITFDSFLSRALASLIG